MGGRAAWHRSAAQVTNLGTLWCRTGLVPAGMPTRQSRPFLVFCKIRKNANQFRSSAQQAQHQNGDLADGTSGAPGAPHEDTCASVHFPTLSGVFCDRSTGALHGHSLPAQNQLLILRHAHCHQLALIRTWSNQFLEPTAETCNKTPYSLTAWQHWQDRRLTAL